MYDEEVGDFRWTEKHKSDLEEHRRSGYREVKKAANIGSFLISETASQALQDFLQEPKGIHEDDTLALFDDQIKRGKHCLEIIKIEARKDLDIRSGWRL